MKTADIHIKMNVALIKVRRTGFPYSNVPYLVADKPIKQAVVELGTIAFQISMIFSSFFREISRKGILISKMDFC